MLLNMGLSESSSSLQSESKDRQGSVKFKNVMTFVIDAIDGGLGRTEFRVEMYGSLIYQG